MASIEQQLTLAQIAINNALVIPDLRDTLAVYGYTFERIAQGQALHQAAQAQYQQTIAAYGDLRQAVDSLDTTEQAAHAQYVRHVKIARIALADDRAALHRLYLASKRKQNRAGWLAQAGQFYRVALSNDVIQQKLEQFSLTQQVLEEGERSVAAVAERQALRCQQQGIARNATHMRNNAITDLEAWMRDFKGIARIALKERPQLLEQLGITTRG